MYEVGNDFEVGINFRFGNGFEMGMTSVQEIFLNVDISMWLLIIRL